MPNAPPNFVAHDRAALQDGGKIEPSFVIGKHGVQSAALIKVVCGSNYAFERRVNRPRLLRTELPANSYWRLYALRAIRVASHLREIIARSYC